MRKNFSVILRYYTHETRKVQSLIAKYGRQPDFVFLSE